MSETFQKNRSNIYASERVNAFNPAMEAIMTTTRKESIGLWFFSVLFVIGLLFI